jgi:NAD(P)-dependent dehydrogenase (short-subunit alcohol dehydrogenase family)
MNGSTKRIAWITGGGTGIGLAGAVALAKEGWEVVISGRRQDVLSRAADTIRSQGGAVDQIVVDVENVEQVNDTAARILKQHNRIDLLINSAAERSQPQLGKRYCRRLGHRRQRQPERPRILHKGGTAGNDRSKGWMYHQRCVMGWEACQ